MNLSDMKANPKNTRVGQHKVICDPCEFTDTRSTEARREAAINRILSRHNDLGKLPHRYEMPHDLTKSLPCHRIPHTPKDCMWEPHRNCSCDCHKPSTALVLYHKSGDTLPNSSGTEEGNPNTTIMEAIDIARRELSFGSTSRMRSVSCWSKNHSPMTCEKSWCECECHRGESQFMKMIRCERAVRNISVSEDNEQVQIGNKFGHVMWVGMEDGAPPVKMVMMPNGSLIGYDEVN